MRLYRLFVLLAVALAAPLPFKGAEAAAGADTPLLVNHLETLTASRLALSKDVAWSKARAGSPISDPTREATMVAALVESGKARGLPAELTARFFRAQIAASKELQQELVAGWSRGAPKPAANPKDLKTEIRPQMDRLNAALLDALAAVPQTVSEKDIRNGIAAFLSSSGYSEAVCRLAAAF